MNKVVHTLEPVYDNDSKILILGSVPSVKSRELGFYYMNKQNRFWKVLSIIFHVDEPLSINDKKAFLKANRIALFDVIKSCKIKGSSDSSITDVEVNDLMPIINNSNVDKIFTTGIKAYKLYNKYLKEEINMEAVYLPSPSAANCKMNINKLVNNYKIIKEYID